MNDNQFWKEIADIGPKDLTKANLLIPGFDDGCGSLSSLFWNEDLYRKCYFIAFEYGVRLEKVANDTKPYDTRQHHTIYSAECFHAYMQSPATQRLIIEGKAKVSKGKVSKGKVSKPKIMPNCNPTEARFMKREDNAE